MSYLTIEDYHNINTINNYYNEIYDIVLIPVDSYFEIDARNIIHLISKYKKYINTNNYKLFSPRLIEEFKKIINQARELNAYIIFGELNINDIYNLNNNLIYYVINNDNIINNDNLSLLDKMNLIFNIIIDDNINFTVPNWCYNHTNLLKHIITDLPYEKILYPEIRILSRFFKKVVVKKIMIKNKHKQKYIKVMNELKFLPNIGIEYFNAKYNFYKCTCM